LNDYFLNPNIAQNATNTISDDTLYKIMSATSTVLTTNSGLNSSGSAGSTFRIHPVFDQLWTGANANIKTNAIIKVLGGTIAGNLQGTGSLALLGTSGTTTLSLTGSAPIYESLMTGTGTLAFGTGASITATGVTLAAPSISVTGATLIADGLVSTSGNITLDSSAVTVGKLKGNNAVTASGDLVLQNNATLQQLATTTTAEYSLEIAATNVTVNSGSKISASGRGYLSPNAAGHRGFNNTIVPAWNTSVSQNAAGSHGGRGGGWGTANEVYGSFANPYTSGASASFGMYNSNGGTAGGGIIRITLGGSGTIQVDGTIENSGADLSSCSGGQGGTGAGGSIYLSGGTLAGSGTVFANGGIASCNVAGGGGGRVAAYFTTLSGNYAWPPTSTWGLRAYGGYRTTGQDQNNGGAGTVYVKLPTDTYGRMALINDSRMVMNSAYTNEPYTTLIVPAVAASTGLTTNTLTAAGGTFNETAGSTGYLAGYAVNPNTAQNATAALSDDALFRITNHTESVLTTASDLAAVGASGNNFRIHPVFDQLFLTNNVVKTNAGIFTRALTLFNGQQIGTGSIAVNSSGNITATGTTNLVTLFSELASAGTIRLTGGTFTFPDAASLSVTFTNSTLTSTGAITTSSGGVTLDNSTLTIGKLRSAGSDGGPDGSALAINSAGALTLQNNALLQQTLTTTTAEYTLEIQAAGLNLSSGSRISATGRGYYNGDYASYYGYFRGFGNVNVGGWGGATG
jgi:hypothetical protein